MEQLTQITHDLHLIARACGVAAIFVFIGAMALVLGLFALVREAQRLSQIVRAVALAAPIGVEPRSSVEQLNRYTLPGTWFE